MKSCRNTSLFSVRVVPREASSVLDLRRCSDGSMSPMGLILKYLVNKSCGVGSVRFRIAFDNSS